MCIREHTYKPRNLFLRSIKQTPTFNPLFLVVALFVAHNKGYKITNLAPSIEQKSGFLIQNMIYLLQKIENC